MSPIPKITSFDQVIENISNSGMGRSPELNNISKNNKICTSLFIRNEGFMLHFHYFFFAIHTYICIIKVKIFMHVNSEYYSLNINTRKKNIIQK